MERLRSIEYTTVFNLGSEMSLICTYLCYSFLCLYIPFVESKLICLCVNSIGFEGIEYIDRMVAPVKYYCSYA